MSSIDSATFRPASRYLGREIGILTNNESSLVLTEDHEGRNYDLSVSTSTVILISCLRADP